MSMMINPFVFKPQGQTLTADPGTFTVTGNDVTFKRSLRMSAEPGVFGLTGNDAALSTGIRMTAEPGAFALTSGEVSFKRSLRMSAATGAFALTGNAATLTYAQNDPNFSSVVLLCGFDGVDGATSSVDDSNSAHTLTFAGGSEIDTAQSKFGGSSLALDGSGDRVSVAASTDWNFGSSPFTIELFVRFNTLTSTSRSVIGSGGTSTVSFVMNVNSGLSDFAFAFSTNGGSSFNQVITSSGVTPATGQWYHLCVDRDGSNKFRLYVDGVMRGSLTTASAVNYESTALAIGATNDSGSEDMSGWLDEVRITKGVARYASDSGFTVPTAAYPRS
ncbi:LamG domain-containing protein [Sinorhizobium fredii]|uniref:LamG domain-containing protein n=1 Tax=Rhizobium fredii TaxID=380 RepID=UPI0004BBF789|nr:LamG domain-containing protein [Sinorhizobium fredii]AWI59007.1 hypothetical protein AB395_00003371 [Sinorhizobium fredii CCBAU 45436]